MKEKKEKEVLVQFTPIAPVIDVGGTLHADTISLIFSSRGAENAEICGQS